MWAIKVLKQTHFSQNALIIGCNISPQVCLNSFCILNMLHKILIFII